jgi:hypothetical protein
MHLGAIDNCQISGSQKAGFSVYMKIKSSAYKIYYFKLVMPMGQNQYVFFRCSVMLNNDFIIILHFAEMLVISSQHAVILNLHL